MRLPGSLLCLGLTAALSAAQAGSAPEVQLHGGPYALPPLVIRAQSNLVEVGVVVRGHDGAIITGLRRDNFRVLDQGVPQDISSFTQVRAPSAGPARESGTREQPASARPAAAGGGPRRYVALFFDDVETGKAELMDARQSALHFLLSRPAGGHDSYAVFAASGATGIEFTDQPAAAAAAVSRISPHPRSGRTGMAACPRITPFQAYEISVVHSPQAFNAAVAEAAACSGADPGSDEFAMANLNDQMSHEEILAQAQATWNLSRSVGEQIEASLGAVVGLLARQPGERVLLAVSGGFLTGTLDDGEDKIIRQALRANVVINALDATGLDAAGPGPGLDEADRGVLPLITFFYDESSRAPQRQAENAAMVNLAQSTGGLFFHDNNDLSLGLRRLGLAPELSYDLAFVPSSGADDGSFHKLKVELVPPIRGAVVQARRGYFAPAPQVASLTDAMNAAMRGTGDSGSLAATLGVRPESGALGVRVSLDLSHLPLASSGGRHREDLFVIAGLFSPSGRFITGRRGEMALALKGATYGRYRRQGISADLTLHAAPGAYRLRVVVGEGNHNSLAAFSRAVSIP